MKYTTPHLRSLGSLATLTLGSGGSQIDVRGKSLL